MIAQFLACASGSAPNLPQPAPEPVATAEAPGALFAVGDLHGDLDNAIAALRLAGLVDEAGTWTGGTATLVQTGDTTDRGPDSLQVMAWLRTLEKTSAAAGGRVVALLGNHEVMNLRGDWRYVAPGDLEAYGGEVARRAAFGPNGEDGRWLRQLGAVAKVGDTVFAHGGVHPTHAKDGIDAINAQVRIAIDQPEEMPVIGVDGPLWFRGYVEQPEAMACPLLDQALGALGAARMVVGHTTRADGHVQARCGGKLLVIDIGIGDAYGGHIGILELRGAATGVDARARYPAGMTDLPDPEVSGQP